MTKYRKLPVEIEALQFRYSNAGIRELREFCSCIGAVTKARCPEAIGEAEVVTLEGIMKAKEGDYIIKGIQGEFYPCKPEIFEATYEKVD